AHELLEGHRRPHDVVQVVTERNLVVPRHALEPGVDVRSAVGPPESHRLRAAGDLGVDVALRHRETGLGEGLRQQRAGHQDLEDVDPVPVDAGLTHPVDAHRHAVD
ncbi:MAG: hypothetical protein ACK56I_27010, partial [bacterium]